MKYPVKSLLSILCMAVLFIVPACTSYDEEPQLVKVNVRLIYPSNSSIGPYKGARVELTNTNASIFVDSTDADGVATFYVPGGLYDASSSQVYLDTVSSRHYRYIFNGRQDKRVVSPDSASNDIEINLTMTRRRIWT